MPLSGELAAMLRARLGEAAHGVYRGRGNGGARAAARGAAKVVAHSGGERVADRAGEDARGMASVRLSVRGPARSRRTGRAIRVSVVADHADHVLDGVERLRVRASVARRAATRSKALDERSASRRTVSLDDITAALNATEMAKRQFRELARVAGLVFPGLSAIGKDRATASGVERTVLRRAPDDTTRRTCCCRRPRTKCWSDSSRARGSEKRSTASRARL